jgi:hypothetical protein
VGNLLSRIRIQISLSIDRTEFLQPVHHGFMPPEVSAESDTPVLDRVDELTRIGSRLIAALSEESSLAIRADRNGNNAMLFREWQSARRRVEEFEREYFDCLDRLNYPERRIRSLIEAAS